MVVQRHERNSFYYLPIHCPFCGKLALNINEIDPVIADCPHTLYIAHDYAFEYLSPRAEQALVDMSYSVTRDDDSVEVDTTDVNGDARGIDEVTDSIVFPDALKVAVYVGPPSGAGSYCGFAPTADE